MNVKEEQNQHEEVSVVLYQLQEYNKQIIASEDVDEINHLKNRIKILSEILCDLVSDY